MVNEGHLNILRQGTGIWNAWRKENRDIKPGLSGANLSGADLAGADLRGAILNQAVLNEASLAACRRENFSSRSTPFLTQNLIVSVINWS
ncbi:MAG: pentapeptide repeat-containing protein [Aggregatilineales bacterium]